MANFIVVGGGQAANLVREWDEVWGLGEQRSHRMAVFAMTWNAKRRFGHHPNFVTVRDVKSLPVSGKPAVILAEPFLRSVTELPCHTALPETWDLTSDSIAAFVADILDAEQLVMLKSVNCPVNCIGSPSVATKADLGSPLGGVVDVSDFGMLKLLADKGLVDVEFPRYASKIPVVGWCNFRR